MRRSIRPLLRATTAVSLLLGAPGPATATPPEGCVGFSSIPAAYVCITQFTPENAVPTVAPGPGQTYTIPEFCVFDCFGPTPVIVPDVVVTQGSGVVAVVQYKGQTYTVTVPPLRSVPGTVAQAQQQISAAVTTVLTTAGQVQQQTEDTLSNAAGGLLVLDGNATFDCFGCGDAYGSMSGTASTVVNGEPYLGAFSATYTMHAGTGTQCAINSIAQGEMDLPGFGQTYFDMDVVGPTVVLDFAYGDGAGSGYGSFIITGPIGLPCGQRGLTAHINAVGYFL
jgi:hypothetical protein